jgi:hypothetical protein
LNNPAGEAKTSFPVTPETALNSCGNIGRYDQENGSLGR